MITLLFIIVLLATHTLLMYRGVPGTVTADDSLTQKWQLLRRSLSDPTFDNNYPFYCCHSEHVNDPS